MTTETILPLLLLVIITLKQIVSHIYYKTEKQILYILNWILYIVSILIFIKIYRS